MAGQAYRDPTKSPGKEITLHMSVAAYLRHAWPPELPWSHFPAGEQRDAAVGAKLKAMGLAAGWPDFVFIMPNGQAAFLELKVGSNGLSAAQIEFKAKARACGCGHATAHTMEEVEAVVIRWLAAYGMTPRARMAVRGAA